KKGIKQGVHKNSFGRPMGYYFHKNHPNERFKNKFVYVPANDILHIKLTRRHPQTRGVTAFHASLGRFQDIEEYELFERTAAKMAASIIGQIKRDKEMNSDYFDAEKLAEVERQIKFAPGMFFDNLFPGEVAEIMNPNGRPNQALYEFLNHNLRMASLGVGGSFGGITQIREASYSAERANMVESAMQTKSKAKMFIFKLRKPTYQRFVQTVFLNNILSMPSDVDAKSLLRAQYKIPILEHIDPLKAANARLKDKELGYKAVGEMIREDNRNPDEVRQQIDAERAYEVIDE
ncbi:MAG: phage portal protein, partial [Thiotrichaceae bacterium]|nr:phage portal protein [Thiotrichaceae bacterium]